MFDYYYTWNAEWFKMVVVLLFCVGFYFAFIWVLGRLTKRKAEDLGYYELNPVTNLDNLECPYKVLFTESVWKKMKYFIMNCNTEIGGHLECKKIDNKIIVYRTILPKQNVSAASYEPDHKELMKLIKADKTIKLGNMKGWFHSHVDMGTFWSSDDERTIQNTLGVTKDYSVSIVLNKQGDYRIRLDIWRDNNQYSYDNIPLYLYFKNNKEDEEKCVRLIKQNVKKSFWSVVFDGF